MPFKIVLGRPRMKAVVDHLKEGWEAGTLGKEEQRLAKKLFKAIASLARDPFYPSLQSHEIDTLTARQGITVYQSYLENQTPGAGRLYWVYGPRRGMITLVGLEPHPEDQKKGGYSRVALARMPTAEELAAEGDPKDS